MRISDWSSDVCSSDLWRFQYRRWFASRLALLLHSASRGGFSCVNSFGEVRYELQMLTDRIEFACSERLLEFRAGENPPKRSEERRVGKGCVRKCRSGRTTFPEKKKNKQHIKQT